MPKIILKNIKGRHGSNGTNGIDGISGRDGLNGVNGLKGAIGEAGTAGSDGSDGINGTDGLNGKNGLAGLSGPQGVAGRDGVDGLPPAHKWVGNTLHFQNPDGSWGKGRDLTGASAGVATRVAGGGGASADDVVDLLLVQGLVESAVAEAKRVDFDGTTLIYTGWAEAGSAEGSLIWRIKRTTLAADGDVTDEWADGDVLYDNSWTNRTSLTYS